MPRLAATWFDPKSGWQVNGAAIYSVNWENPATDYETGNILNLDGAITKNFGPLGVGVVSYAMIQTTGDSGAGARLGSFESRVYGVGPIVTFTTSADPSKALTVLAKWYHEFDAEHTFEGNTVRRRRELQVLAALRTRASALSYAPNKQIARVSQSRSAICAILPAFESLRQEKRPS